MEKADTVDRISELPESILHHILSFLAFKQVVQTCILSKTWLKAWHTYPILEFNEKFFVKDLSCEFVQGRGVLEVRLYDRIDCLERTLRNREKQTDKYAIKKFTLETKFFAYPNFVSIVDGWIYHVVKCNVREFKLEIESWLPRWYLLPQIIYSAKSVDVLELQGCALLLPKHKVKLDSLRKLHLSQVYVDDEIMEDLIAGCPMIEDLCLNECKGITNLKLVDVAKLKEIKLQYNYKLEYVLMKQLDVQSVLISGSLISHDIFIDSCMSLKCLKLSMVFISDEWLRNQISLLPLLEYLVIERCHELVSIRILSPRLKTLIIDTCTRVAALELETPNLSEFTYVGYVMYFSSNALELSEANISIHSHNINIVDDTQWYVGYIQLLAKFCHSKVLNIESTKNEAVIIPRKVRQIQPSPLLGVKNVNFISKQPSMVSSINEVLDGLLWIAPHAENISIKFDKSNKSSFKFSYKNQLDYGGDMATYYKSFPVSCWQHCIKEVEIENDTMPEEEDSASCRSNDDDTMEIPEGNVTKRYYLLSDEEIMEIVNDICSQMEEKLFD